MTIDVPVFRFDVEPAVDAALRDAAARVLASRWYVLGREVEGFEREFAAYCGVRHAVGLANGTDALELALRAAGVGTGSRVATVANAGYYTSTALAAIGAEPVYVDVGDDLTMSPASLAGALAGVQAVVVTHLYGKLAPIDEIVALARGRGVSVLEDCAQAHGAQRGGVRAGAFGAMACFSFYPTKNLGAIGDGGAIVTSDDALATRVRTLRQYGWSAKYRVEHAGGRNSRLDEIQAAFLRAKLPQVDRDNAARISIARRYQAGLSGLPIELPQWQGNDYVAHLFVIRTAERDALRMHLAAAGIGSDVHYPIPDHLQPVRGGAGGVSLPATERACREVLTLPCFPGLRGDEVDRVIAGVHSFFHG
jgi:dTDP-3-amino-2,3,6-trideoxy-4-keto-D-glucose/dTDP-3-amino-3,4,6-trideoxy-alpha-D-glucose/dTDP-2,6-dideoxy-D-kanosamine transaminase